MRSVVVAVILLVSAISGCIEGNPEGKTVGDTTGSALDAATGEIDNCVPHIQLPAVLETNVPVTIREIGCNPPLRSSQYSWTINGTAAGAGQSLSYVFDQPGNYTIHLGVTQSGGAETNVTAVARVEEPNNPPTASIAFSPPNPGPGDPVQFSAIASDPDGTISTYVWNFGDGFGSDNATPVHNFSMLGPGEGRGCPGGHLVTLVVVDDRGGEASASRCLVTMPVPPTAGFIFFPDAPTPRESIHFVPLADDLDGQIVNYTWSFGDGEKSYDERPIHAFLRAPQGELYGCPGGYRVQLKVVDDDGLTADFTQCVLVTAQAPVAAFAYHPVFPRPGETIGFFSTSTDDDSAELEYQWSFGDGEKDSIENPQHSFGFAPTTSLYGCSGGFLVKLHVADQDGLVSKTSRCVPVADSPPQVSFDFTPTAPAPGDSIRLHPIVNNPGDGQVEWLWEFADGSTNTERNPIHEVGSPADPLAPTCPGAYSVRLTVTNSYGESDSDQRCVPVVPKAPTASFTFTPSLPAPGDVIEFSSTSTDSDGVVEIHRWFNHEGESLSTERSWSMEAPTLNEVQADPCPDGFSVRLSVQDDDEAEHQIQRCVPVRAIAPTIIFTHWPEDPAPGDEVTFTAHATDEDGPDPEIDWTFSDGSAKDGVKVVHQFQHSPVGHQFGCNGGYQVTATAVDEDGATGTFTRCIRVTIKSPEVSLVYEPTNPAPGDPVTFRAQAHDPDGIIQSYNWTFSDGTQATGPEVDHAFAAAPKTDQYGCRGGYSVSVRVVDDDGGEATAERCVSVAVKAPRAEIQFSPATPGPNDLVEFRAVVTDDGDIVNTTWAFGDWENKYGREVQRTFAAPGEDGFGCPQGYTVTLNVLDEDGGSDSVSTCIRVLAHPPKVVFSYWPSNPAPGDQVSFRAEATDSDGTVTELAWSFGDGNGSDEVNPTHAFGVPSGEGPCGPGFLVSLLVTDDDGFDSETSQCLAVQARPPTVQFSYYPENPAPGDALEFIPVASDPDGEIETYSWTFGQVGTSAEKIPEVTFDQVADGLTQGCDSGYLVQLVVTDDDGAQAAAEQCVKVEPRNPTADFYWWPEVPSPGQQVTFQQLAEDVDGQVVAFNWTFGDGMTGAGSTVDRIFDVAPTTAAFGCQRGYTVTLHVVDDDGGLDEKTACVPVESRAPQVTFTHWPEYPAPGDSVDFVATGTDSDGEIIEYTWVWGDGGVDEGPRANHSFAVAPSGNGFGCAEGYRVTVTATDNHGIQSSFSRCVPVKPIAPDVEFVFTPEYPQRGELVAFNATIYDVDAEPGEQPELRWEFRDGGTANIEDPAYTFEHAPEGTMFGCLGGYQVRLTVVDADRGETTVSRCVPVSDPA